MNRISITLNSNCDRPKRAHDYLRDTLIYHFGGVSISENIGYWRNDSGRLYEDTNFVYTSYNTDGRDILKIDIEILLDTTLAVSGEECIFYDIDGIGHIYCRDSEVIGI